MLVPKLLTFTIMSSHRHRGHRVSLSGKKLRIDIHIIAITSGTTALASAINITHAGASKTSSHRGSELKPVLNSDILRR